MKAAKRSNSVRIIGGELRRRLIHFPDAEGLRPTPDRVRETLFNWLGQTLEGKHCLDLFAGSGALGFEAASRGARSVVMVEANRMVFRSLEENCRIFALHNIVELRNQDALECIPFDARKFDVIFLDPPFRKGFLEQALARVAACLAEGGRVYAESAEKLVSGEGWEVLREGRAGEVHFHLLMRSSNA